MTAFQEGDRYNAAAGADLTGKRYYIENSTPTVPSYWLQPLPTRSSACSTTNLNWERLLT